MLNIKEQEESEEEEEEKEAKDKKVEAVNVEPIDVSYLTKMYACIALGTIYVYLKFVPHPFH